MISSGIIYAINITLMKDLQHCYCRVMEVVLKNVST